MAIDLFERVERTARVGYVGARIYLRYKQTQRAGRKLGPAAREARWERAHAASAEELYRLAVDLQGLLIKTGQFISTRTDMVPPAYVTSLSRLQDRVPPRRVHIIRRTIEEAFDRSLESLFGRFDARPLAAASLAQVHRAALKDGREVCVKVQYPDVRDTVTLDVRNLKTIVAVLARREPNFDYRAIVNEVARQVPLELDFVREAEMTQRVRANLCGMSGIVIPEVVEGYVRREVVVTEYLPGERLVGPGGPSPRIQDRIAAAQAITEAFGHQIMVDGLFQADPHPGNLLAMPDGRIGLLDFGLTKELPAATRLAFARLVVAAAERNPLAVVEAFEGLGMRIRGGSNPEGVLALTELFFGSRPDRKEMAGKRSAALERTPIEAIPTDLILLGRVVGLLRGVCQSLGAPLTPMEMLYPFARRALAEQE